MHRIDGPGATGDNRFTEGDPASATPATTVTDDWLNAVQEEIAAVIESAGIALSKGSNGQLLSAIASKISAAIPTNVPQGNRGAFSNLRISATGASAVVSVTADELTLASALPAHRSVQAVSLSINSASVGANGLDAGTLAASTWYSVWVAWNGTTTIGLLSLSATSPTLPPGYTHKARVGWVRTDGSANKYPLGFKQSGRLAQYAVSASGNVTALPIMASGVAGNTSTPVYAAVSVSSFAPPTSAKIHTTVTQTTSGASASCAPNDAYGNYFSTDRPPANTSTYNSTGVIQAVSGDMALESSSIYWTSSGAGGRLLCRGWEDNL